MNTNKRKFYFLNISVFSVSGVYPVRCRSYLIGVAKKYISVASVFSVAKNKKNYLCGRYA